MKGLEERSWEIRPGTRRRVTRPAIRIRRERRRKKGRERSDCAIVWWDNGVGGRGLGRVVVVVVEEEVRSRRRLLYLLARFNCTRLAGTIEIKREGLC